MKKEAALIAKLLPKHYTCEPIIDGVNCCSRTGLLDEHGDEAFEVFKRSLKVIFKTRFSEIFHSTCTNHANFTVYLKP